MTNRDTVIVEEGWNLETVLEEIRHESENHEWVLVIRNASKISVTSHTQWHYLLAEAQSFYEEVRNTYLKDTDDLEPDPGLDPKEATIADMDEWFSNGDEFFRIMAVAVSSA